MSFEDAPGRLRALASYAITHAAARAAALAADRIAQTGASKASFGVLAVLEEFGPSSQADVARRLGMDGRSMSEEAAHLERRDLIVRAPDPTDSRRNRLEITTAGVALLAQLDGVLTAMQDDLLAPLSAPERRQLEHALAAINRATGPGAQEGRLDASISEP